MTMKFDTPGQTARLNAEFDKLTKDEKEVVLRLVAMARQTLGMHLQYEGTAYAYKRPGDAKIAWGINNADTGFCVTRGVFPE